MKALPHLAQLGSVTVFSVGLVVYKTYADAYPLTAIIFWQFVLAAVLLWGLTLWLDGVFAAGRSDGSFMLKVLGWGMVAPGMVLVLNIRGAVRTDGITLTVLWSLLPLLVPLLARIFLAERIHRLALVGALIAGIAVVITTASREAAGWSEPAGIALVAAAVLCACFGQLFGRAMNRGKLRWRRAAAIQVTGAAVIAAAVALPAGEGLPLPVGEAAHAAGFAYTVLIMTFANFLLFNYGLANLPLTWISLYVAAAPIAGTIASLVLLETAFSLVDAAMIALIVFGIALPHMTDLLRRSSLKAA